jgi:hypothetical protein
MAIVNDIASALKTLADGVSGMPSGEVRKTDVVHPGDTLPFFVIAYQTEYPEDWAVCGAGGTDRGSIGMAYEFVISIYRAGSGNVTSGATTNPNLLEDLREVISKGSLTGATTVWAIELQNRPQWEDAGFADMAEVSRFFVRVGSSEARNG